MSKQPEIGAGHPTIDAPRLKAPALVQLIATVTLALCTLIIATAVSIGLVRADVPGGIAATHIASVAADRNYDLRK